MSKERAHLFRTTTVAGRPEPAKQGRPTKFPEAAEWTGGFSEGDDAMAVRIWIPRGLCVHVDECSSRYTPHVPRRSEMTAGHGPLQRFRCPGGCCEAEDGALFVSDAYNHVIRRRDPTDTLWRTLAGKPGEKGVLDGKGGDARFSYPQRIALHDARMLVVAGGGSHVLHMVDTASGLTSTLAGAAGTPGGDDGNGAEARFSRPIGLAVDRATREIYVGDVGGHAIRRVTKIGDVTTLAGKFKEKGFADGSGGGARFNQPCGIAVKEEDSHKVLIVGKCCPLIRKWYVATCK